MIAPILLATVAVLAAPQGAALPDEVTAVNQDLFTWRADVLTRTDGPEALDTLRGLVVRADALLRRDPSSDRCVELLTELVSEELAWLQRAQDQRALAARTLELVGAVVEDDADPAVASRAKALRRALSPDLVQLALGPAVERIAGAGTGAGDAVVGTAVLDALQRGDLELLQQLGSAAVPHLVDASRTMDGRPVAEGAQGPLVALLRLDLGRGLEVALELARSEDLLIKARVASALSVTGILSGDEIWRTAVNRELGASVVAALRAEPAPVGRTALTELVRPFIERDALTPALRDAARDWLRENPLDVRPVPGGAVDLALELVDAPEPHVARRAAELLLDARAMSSLRSRGGKRTDGALRELIATSFAPRAGAPDSNVIDAGYRTALAAFLGDGPIDDTAARALDGALLMATQAGVPAATGGDLEKWLGQVSPGQPGIIETLIDHALLADPGTAGKVVAAVFDRMDEDPEGWPPLIEKNRSASGYIVYRPFLRGLPTALKLRMIRDLERADYDALRSLDDDDLGMSRDAWLELVQDPGLGCDARLWAMGQFVSAQGGPVGKTSPKAVVEAIAQCAASCGDVPVAARDLSDAGVDPEAVIRALMDREGVPAGVLLDTYVPLNDRALVERILERFPPVTWPQASSSPLLAAVATHLVIAKDPAWNGVLRQAWSAGGTIRKSVMDQIGYLRSPAHRELSPLLLQEPGLRSTSTRKAAMAYVASFRDAEALDALIEAARTTRDDQHRAELEAEIDSLLAWLDTEARWRAGRSEAERRKQAIAELVAIIEDTEASVDARAAAIRSLPALDAVEESPRLIKLLERGTKALKTAAREALESLQR